MSENTQPLDDPVVEDVVDALQLLTPLPFSLTLIPQEIFAIILSHLSLRDLTKCARVSRPWNSDLAPYIWKSVDIDTPKKLDRFLTAEAQQALVRYADCVESLHLRYPELLDMFDPAKNTTSNILELEIYFSMDPKACEQAITLVRNNPSLESLTVRAPQDDGTMKGLVDASGPSLQKLDISHRVTPKVAKYLLDNLPENIESVRLAVCAPHTQYQLTGPTVPRKQHQALKSLRIDGNFEGVEGYILLPFLYGCTHLKEFETPKTGCYRNRTVRAALWKLGLPLKKLTEKELPANARDKDVAKVIATYPGLKSVRLNNYFPAGRHSAAAIAKNSETLESLEVQGCAHLSIEPMSKILATTHNLKTLKAIDLGSVYKGTDPWIWSTYIDEFGCATTALEIFHCVINVIRPNSHVPVEHHHAMYRTMAEPDQVGVSLQFQEAVYRMFGRQTNVREIRLGYENALVNSSREESYFQWYCVEMTLATGLYHMQNLKELRLLDVSYMNHRMGVAELEWMKVNWSLERLTGVFDNGKDPDPAIEDWIEANQATWVVS